MFSLFHHRPTKADTYLPSLIMLVNGQKVSPVILSNYR